jgi:hypothetical protein
MSYRALASTPDGCIVYLTDDFGRLLQMWGAPSPQDFRTPAAQLVAALVLAS